MELVRGILIGKQGSGKSTHREVIATLLGLTPICSGELVRDEMRRGTEFGQRVKAQMDAGHLLADEDVEQLVFNALAQAESTGWILDGYPRRSSQAEKLLAACVPTVIIHLDLTDWTAMTRLTHRRVCATCGRNFHLLAQPPLAPGVCDACGSSLQRRDDDHPKAIRKRMEAFDRETLPILPLFEAAGVPIIRIDAAPSIDEVGKQLLWRLGRHV